MGGWRAGRVICLTAGTLAAAFGGGCGSHILQPDFDVWAGIGVEKMTLFNRPDGFWWQDDSVWNSTKNPGVITIQGNQLTADGGICGIPGWGECAATFTPPVVQVSVPDGPNAPSIVYHLERVNGALQVRDDADYVLVSLQPRTSGADVFDHDGNFIDRADWDVKDPAKLWVTTTLDSALIGWSFGAAVPPDIGALAQGAILQTATQPPIPDHAIVIAAALTWLR